MGAILSNFPSQQGYIDFDDVKAAVLLSLDLLVPELLPGGKRVGKNWVVCNPTRDDKSASFSVSMETGAWFDFATKDRGKNFIGLVMYITGESYKEANHRLADKLGVKPRSGSTSLTSNIRSMPPLNGAGGETKKLIRRRAVFKSGFSRDRQYTAGIPPAYRARQGRQAVFCCRRRRGPAATWR